MRKKALFVVPIWIVVACAVFALYLLRDVAPVKEFIAWALSVWPILAALGGIAMLISGWVIKHNFGSKTPKALSSIELYNEESLILTPLTYAMGLSGFGGYPNEPDNAEWLCLEVFVNPIDKPIDTLDLIIDGKTIPANYWPGKNVTAFNVYFNVTGWRWKGKNQVELIAHVGGITHTSGRITIDFNVEVFGIHRI